jgi:hypothetical protein
MPSDEELIADLQETAAKHGEPLSSRTYDEHGSYYAATVERHFESWNNGLREAGIETNEVSDEDLISDLRQSAAEHGGSLSFTAYDHHGTYGAATVQRHFGSWNDGLKKAGLDINRKYWENVGILKELRRITDDNIAPSQGELRAKETVSPSTVKNQFGRWWKGTVSAGLRPRYRRPLTPKQFDQLYNKTIDLPPEKSLPTLLVMFSGMSSQTIFKFSIDWVRENRDQNILKVPAEVTGGEPWFVRLPETWVNPHTGERIPTKLPETLEWVLDNYGEIPIEHFSTVYDRCFNIAKIANIESREWVSRRRKGKVPAILPADLSYTHGANLVRQGIDSDIIKRRLGANGYRPNFYLNDIMLWVYVHDNYEHPEFSPPSVVLDPDTGEPRYS